MYFSLGNKEIALTLVTKLRRRNRWEKYNIPSCKLGKLMLAR